MRGRTKRRRNVWRKRSRDRQRSTRRREAGAERGRGIRGSPRSRACGKRDSPLPPQVHDMISWFWLRRGLHKDERGRKRVTRPKKRRQGDHLHAASWAPILFQKGNSPPARPQPRRRHSFPPPFASILRALHDPLWRSAAEAAIRAPSLLLLCCLASGPDSACRA